MRSVVLVNGNSLFRYCAGCLRLLRSRLVAVNRGGFLACASSGVILILILLVTLLPRSPEHEFLPVDQSTFLQWYIRRARLSLAGPRFIRRLALCSLLLLLPLCAILCSLCLRKIFSLLATSLKLFRFCFLLDDDIELGEE